VCALPCLTLQEQQSHLEQCIAVAVGQIVLQPSKQRLVVKRKVKLFKSQPRLCSYNQAPVALRQQDTSTGKPVLQMHVVQQTTHSLYLCSNDKGSNDNHSVVWFCIGVCLCIGSQHHLCAYVLGPSIICPTSLLTSCATPVIALRALLLCLRGRVASQAACAAGVLPLLSQPHAACPLRSRGLECKQQNRPAQDCTWIHSLYLCT
jgi:hypothetical protein